MSELQNQFASPEQIFEIVNEIFLKVEIRKLSEQRISERKAALLPIEIQFLDADSKPVSEKVSAITRDVSVGGIGIVSPSTAAGPKAIVQFTTLSSDTPALLIEIRYSNQLGPFYMIGGSFCADWSTVDFG